MTEKTLRHSRRNRQMAVVAGLLAAATVLVGYCWDLSVGADRLIVGLWVVGPPAWLFVEWFFFLKPAVEAEELTMEMVSHEQSVVRAMWAGFLVAIAVLYEVYPFATAQ